MLGLLVIGCSALFGVGCLLSDVFVRCVCCLAVVVFDLKVVVCHVLCSVFGGCCLLFVERRVLRVVCYLLCTMCAICGLYVVVGLRGVCYFVIVVVVGYVLAVVCGVLFVVGRLWWLCVVCCALLVVRK